MKKRHNYREVIADKSLQFIRNLDEAILRNRVFYGFCSFSEGQSIDHTDLDNKNDQGIVGGGMSFLTKGVTSIIPASLLQWHELFYVIVTSKAFVEEKADDKLIEQHDLSVWMEPDVVYFFKYSKKGDKSDHVKTVSGGDMQMVEFTNDKDLPMRYNLTIQTSNNILILGLKYATKANGLEKALKRAKKSMEEVSRTRDGVISRNIDPFIEHYKNHVSFMKVIILGG